MRKVNIVAQRGRKDEGCTEYEQRFEVGGGSTSNTITSVYTDNLLLEREVYCLQYVRNDFGRSIRKKYESGKAKAKIGQMRDPVPRADGLSNTITTILKDNIIMEKELMPEPIEDRPKGKGWKWVPEESLWFRLRKLTPRECFRLMDVREKDIDKIQTAIFPDKKSELPIGYGKPDPATKQTNISNSQQYKMAGNSIVVSCMAAIFHNLFTRDEVIKETLF